MSEKIECLDEFFGKIHEERKTKKLLEGIEYFRPKYCPRCGRRLLESPDYVPRGYDCYCERCKVVYWVDPDVDLFEELRGDCGDR